MLAELKRCLTWFIYFLYLLYWRYNCTKFHHYKVRVTDFREGWGRGGFLPTPSVMPILNRVKKRLVYRTPPGDCFLNLCVLKTSEYFHRISFCSVDRHTSSECFWNKCKRKQAYKVLLNKILVVIKSPPYNSSEVHYIHLDGKSEAIAFRIESRKALWIRFNSFTKEVH